MLTGHPTNHLDPFPASVPPVPKAVAPASSSSSNSLSFLLWRRQTDYLDGNSNDKDAMAAAAERGAYGGVDGGGGGYYGGSGGGGGGSDLSTGAIVGIVLGCILCLMILIWICWCCAAAGGRRRRRSRSCESGRYRHRRRRDGSACSYVRSRPRYERGRALVVENSVCRPEPVVCSGGCRGCKYY
ncbi:hypothetical protein PG996_015364 [Apiospora saccharicola]|uniref:Uncharacterized protein n=1 Tax=Apiospora saccharicola TaxID=335842 RepID=A0ABR1TN11_9PEZI